MRAAEGSSDAPIFIVGTARSGTTLLQGLIGSHRAIAAPPEIYFFLRLYDLRGYWGDLADDERLRAAVHELLHPAYPLLDGCGFDDEVVFQRARAGERTYAGLLRALMADFTERQGKRRWCEKSPGQHAAQVWEVFPDAQVVHIVRDPREVVASKAALPWEDLTIVESARAWHRHTLRTLQSGHARGPDHYVMVRHEDLTRAPSAVMRQVFSFLGEDPAAAALDDPARRAASVVAGVPWQQRVLEPVTATTGPPGLRLTRRQRAQVAALTRDLLPGLGYPRATRRAVLAGLAVSALEEARTRPRRRPRHPPADPAALHRLVDDRLRLLAERARRAEAGTGETLG